MFERVKYEWDKIIYVAIGFFVLFYVSFYFSSFSVEPPKQNTREIIVTEFFDEDDTSSNSDVTESNEMDKTVEEILDEIHSDANMCKKLSSNVQREIYCNQLDESTCKVKECCVSLHNNEKEFSKCTVGDETGPTYAQPKTMKFFSYDGEKKEEL